RQGRFLGWQGDGGIAVFPGSNDSDEESRAENATRAAEDILTSLPNVNARHELADHDEVRVRLALHAGAVIWAEETGSIHSTDLNFVAHLQSALPHNVVGLTWEIFKGLNTRRKACCVEVGVFEDRHVYLYAADKTAREAAAHVYRKKERGRVLGSECEDVGLYHLEYREEKANILPPVEVFANARDEILMVGVTLARSFKSESEILAPLREVTQRNVKLRLLVLHPDSEAGRPFARGAESFDSLRGSLREELDKGRIKRERVYLRGLQFWPHFSGVMIDGDAEGEIPVQNEGLGRLSSVVLRVQPGIPPDGAPSQHFAPIFEFRRMPASATMAAFIRGFRFGWQNGEPLNL
ncbi:hypothetical protein ACFL0Q_08760, partial [Thermodesulfobacteriota bacterium]